MGGIYRPPPERRAGTLRVTEREEISRNLAAGDSYRAIERCLGRPASTIYLKVDRNKVRMNYRAVDADDRARSRAKRPKICLLEQRPALSAYVKAHLREHWSPEQIGGTLQKRSPEEGAMCVSAETIDKTRYFASRGVLSGDIHQRLRFGRSLRRTVRNTITGRFHSQIKGALPFRHCPPEVDARTVPGNWQGYLLPGRQYTKITTLVERITHFTVLVHLTHRDMHADTAGLSREMGHLPEDVPRSLTWDRGIEVADHRMVTAHTGLDVNFSDLRSPWQRGTNEHINRLPRQNFPMGPSMGALKQDDLNAVAAELNGRPQKTLDFETLADRLHAHLR